MLRIFSTVLPPGEVREGKEGLDSETSIVGVQV